MILKISSECQSASSNPILQASYETILAIARRVNNTDAHLRAGICNIEADFGMK
jgi:hypothetical protein